MSKSNKRKRILFVQLPLLDNDPEGLSENHRLAAAYLQCALERAGEDRYFEPVIAGMETDRLDNRHTVEFILAAKPYAVVATLYVWNVERSLNVLRSVRRSLPGAIVMLGGPEAARRHPFLFRAGIADVVVSGEGEPVFPAVLQCLRRGKRTNFDNVAWRAGPGYRWGWHPAPVPALRDMLPPPGHELNRPDGNGVAYMETTRGCPGKCAFCCYRQRRARMSRLPVPDVVRRIRVLRRRGAREIRFIDPTFNAHPQFESLLEAISRLNADRRLSFFAEIRADTVTERTASLLAAANVREVEIGVQSSDPSVLRAIGRPVRPERVLEGIGRLAGQGLAATLDVMCGLPGQTFGDVRRTVTQLARIRGGRVQLLHTLLIPGSDLRGRRRHYGLKAQDLPPYRITSTPAMSREEIVRADEFAADFLGIRQDCPASRFVAFKLPDLFREKVIVNLDHFAQTRRIEGRECRRALIFRDDNLFRKRNAACEVVRKAIREEPDILWQFVLCPAREEPLDLVDRMIEAVDEAPEHFTDRLHVRHDGTHRVSRRVFVMLRLGRSYEKSWIAEAESLLSLAFF